MADKTYNLKVKLSNGTTVDAGNFTAPQGPKGDKGDTGSQGPKPVKGTDYFTAADKEEIVDDVIEAMPTIPISKGGTGATTDKAASYNLLGGMTEETTDAGDGSMFAFAYVDGTASTGATFKRSGTRVWNWIKAKTDALYAAVTHKHAATDINSGTLSSDRLPTVPISKGGTGATTAKAAHYNILNSINLEDTNNPYDDTKFIFEYDEPNSSKGVLYKRSGARVWNWIKAKTDALYAAVSHSHSTATTSANGFMSSSDKSKLNGIATGANAYTHPTTSGNKHIPSGGSSGQILRWSSDGTAVWGNDNNTTYTLGSFGVTASATELNYTDGVTSNIQTQLNSKAASSHNHDSTYVNVTGDTMTGGLSITGGTVSPSAGKPPLSAVGTYVGKNGLAISNPSTVNDVGWIRVTGTSESDTVLEIAVGDDGAVGEKIVVRQYNTSNNIVNEIVLLDTSGNTSFPRTVTAPTFSGTLSGNASTSTKATQDSAGQQINSTYIKGLSVSGKTITYTRGDNTTGTITTQDTNTTYSAATTGAAGLMSAADKTKLDGIAAGANAYSLPTASSSTLGGVKTGSNITNSSGTISLTKANVTSALGYTPPTTNTTYSTATSSTLGLVKIGYTESGKNYPVELNSSGQMYVNVPWTDNNTTYSAATTSNNGLMTTTQVTALNNAVPKSGTTMTGPLVAYNTANTNICLRNSVVFASGSTTTRASTFQLNYYRK